MEPDEKSASKAQSWWQTLPGICTAIAGLIGAVVTLIAALDKAELLPRRYESKTGKMTPALLQPAPRDPHDLAYENSLLGRWSDEVTLPDGGRWEVTTTFTDDGRFISIGPVYYGLQRITLTIGGTWSVKNGSIYSETDSGSSNQVPLHLKSSGKILNLTADEYEYVNGIDNRNHVARRVK